MTDNIKAKGDEIYMEFHDILEITDMINKPNPYAVKCAIKEVEEIIEASSDFAFDPEIYNGQNPMTNYWIEVLNYLKSKQ